MVLWNFIKREYSENTPIIYRELLKKLEKNKSEISLRSSMSRLYRQDRLKRFCKGVYFYSSDNGSLNNNEVIEALFIRNAKKTYGIEGPMLYANELGMTLNRELVKTIISNNESTRNRKLAYSEHFVKKSKVKINKSNCEAIKILELIKDIEKIIDNPNYDLIKDEVSKLDERNQISFLKLISKYPRRVSVLCEEKGILDILNSKVS